jgi:hypothetical protein
MIVSLCILSLSLFTVDNSVCSELLTVPLNKSWKQMNECKQTHLHLALRLSVHGGLPLLLVYALCRGQGQPLPFIINKKNVPIVISGFRRGCYATHRLVIYWRFEITYHSVVSGQGFQEDCLSFESGTDRLFRNVQNNYQSTLRRIPEEGRCQNVPPLSAVCGVPNMFPVITALQTVANQNYRPSHHEKQMAQ